MIAANEPAAPPFAPAIPTRSVVANYALLYILVSGLLGVVGQLILKRGMAGLGPLTLRPDSLMHVVSLLVFNPLVILGLAVYVSGTFFWLLALSRVDLSFAYPFASLNYVFVLIASWVLLGERLSPIRLLGVAVITLGVVAISRGPAVSQAGGRGVTAAPVREQAK